MSNACQLVVDILAIQKKLVHSKILGVSSNSMSSLSTNKKLIPQNAMDNAVLFSKMMKEENIPYAIGGALAAGFWSIPRA